LVLKFLVDKKHKVLTDMNNKEQRLKLIKHKI
jgi:hypothetical protein